MILNVEMRTSDHHNTTMGIVVGNWIEPAVTRSAPMHLIISGRYPSFQVHEGGIATVPGMEAGNTHSTIVGPIQDCLVLISRGMGYGADNSLRAAGIEPIITDVRDIDEAARQYLGGELKDCPERLH